MESVTILFKKERHASQVTCDIVDAMAAFLFLLSKKWHSKKRLF